MTKTYCNIMVFLVTGILENTFFWWRIHVCWKESNLPKFRQDFFWQEIYWQDFCQPIWICLVWEELISVRNEKLQVWEALRSYYFFLFLIRFISIWNIFFQNGHSIPKCDKNAYFLTNILVQFLNILGSGSIKSQSGQH